MPKETSADRLRKRRIELGYADAATAARQRGFIVRTYQAHEAGTKPIGKKNQQRYADSYGLTLDYLVSGKTHSNKGATGIPQPPLGFRYIPLLSTKDIVGGGTKMDLLATETSAESLVSASNDLGLDIVAFVMPDNSMFHQGTDPDNCIRQDEEVVVDPHAAIEPGDAVGVVFFNPHRLTARTYAPLEKIDAGGNRVELIRLIAINPIHSEKVIASAEDGFVLGKAVYAQSSRAIKKR